MLVRRKVPMSDEVVREIAGICDLTESEVRALGWPVYTKVERVVFDKNGDPQVNTTTCCCKAAGALRRICARVSGNKTPCRCFCHSLKPARNPQ